jgi:Ala-tRNA(Pro) deacylase
MRSASPPSTLEHPPAFTVEEGEKVMGHLPGVHIKNLFLCDAKEVMWLVVAPWDRVIDLKRLPTLIGAARISFGSANRRRSSTPTPSSIR